MLDDLSHLVLLQQSTLKQKLEILEYTGCKLLIVLMRLCTGKNTSGVHIITISKENQGAELKRRLLLVQTLQQCFQQWHQFLRDWTSMSLQALLERLESRL